MNTNHNNKACTCFHGHDIGGTWYVPSIPLRGVDIGIVDRNDGNDDGFCK